MSTEDIDLIGQMDKAISDHNNDKGTIDDETAKRLAETIPQFEQEEEEKEPIQDAEVVEGPPVTEKEREEFRSSARRYVRTFNSLLKLIFPPLYRRKVMHPGDSKLISDYKREKDLNPNFKLSDAISSEDKLYYALKRYEALEQYISDIPLTQDEQNDLAEPLAELIEKRRAMKLTPELSLLLSAGIIMIPRLEPFFPSITNIFKGEE